MNFERFRFAFAIGVLLAAMPAALWAGDGHCPAANASNLQQELKQVTQNLLDDLATGSKQLWSECLSDVALITGDDGLVLSKDKFLDELRPLPQGYQGRIQIVRPQLLHREHFAVLSYDLDEQETIFGQRINQRYHTTDTWALENGRWRLVASQATRLYQDPAENVISSRASGDLVGTYELAPGVHYTITLEQNQFFGERSGRKKELLLPESTDVLFRKGAPVRKMFVRNAQGAVTGFVDRVNGADLVWPRKSAAKEAPAMKQFVLFYRQGPIQLSEADQKRRLAEVREWAQKINHEGRKLDGRILSAERKQIAPAAGADQKVQNDDQSLIAITFLEARDFAEAVTVAQTHPGLHYGVSIEVREWTPPPTPPASPATEQKP